MKITVKTLKGEQFPLEVNPEDTILSVKEQLNKLKGFDVSSQKLLLKGKMTQDANTIEASGIKDNDFLVVTVMVKKAAKPVAPPQENKMEEEKPQESQQPQQQQSQQPQQQQQQQSQQPQEQQSSQQADSDLVTGSQYDEAVNTIMGMGLGDGDKDKIKRALAAAYNNVERAIEYLLSGNIPQAPVQQQQPQQVQQPQQDQGEIDDMGEEGNPQIAQLVNNPLFQQIRQIIQQNPQMAPQILGPIMQQLQQNNPEIHELIQQNQEQFLTQLMGGAGGQGGQGQAPPGTIQVTPEEKAAIDRITDFGFSRMDAIEAFLCCGKDENLAVNYLLENQATGGLMSEHIKKEEEEEAIQASLTENVQQPQGDQGNNNNNNNDQGNNNNNNNNQDQNNNNDSNNNNNNEGANQ